MKKITLILILSLIASLSFAQITLEHEYADKYSSSKIIKLELDGYKYLMYGKLIYKVKGIYSNDSIAIGDSTVYLYNLDHSIYKVIKSNHLTRGAGLHFISQNLFNLDSKVELLISTYNRYTQRHSIKILSDDGSLLFSDTLGIYGFGEKNIQNTTSGTKMILHHSYDRAKIYSLPGKLELTGVDNFDQKNKDLYPFPNPSNNIINIPYKLNAKEIAKVTITDYLGKVIKTYTVDNAFNTLIVNLDDLNSGTYLYTVEKERDIISQGKFIVSK